MTKRDDLNTPLIVLVGFVSTILCLVTVLALTVVFHKVQEGEHYRKVILPEPEEVRSLSVTQQAKLASYAWIDEQQQIVQIPIELAMDLVVQELSAESAAR